MRVGTHTRELVRARTAHAGDRVAAAAAVLSVAFLTSCGVKPQQVETLHGGTLATLREAQSIEALTDVATVPGRDARMRRAERVVAFVAGETPVAVSLRLLDDHEIVNLAVDTSGERRAALAATW